MKILFINDQFERGGAGRVAAVLCNELHHRKDYEVSLVCDSKHWEPLYHIDVDIPVREIVVKTLKPGFAEKLLKWKRCINDIRRYIKEEKPDIIIATQAMMFLCAYLANRGLHVPIIAADHTSFSRKVNPIIDFIRYHLYSKADGLSILTQKDFRLLGDKYPQKKVIYNPLSFPVLDKQVVRRKNILCAGRLEVWEIKGFDIIVDIWSRIHAKYPDWVLEIAGDGTEASHNYMKQMLVEKGVQDHVRLLGRVSDMKSLYAESSIFALPSRMEGFPMVLMEAMSQGCACVAFSVGGSSDEMMSEKSGLLMPDGDASSFEAALVRLIENGKERELFSQNAIKEVSRFSVDFFMDEWEKLINETLKK